MSSSSRHFFAAYDVRRIVGSSVAKRLASPHPLVCLLFAGEETRVGREDSCCNRVPAEGWGAMTDVGWTGERGTVRAGCCVEVNSRRSISCCR